MITTALAHVIWDRVTNARGAIWPARLAAHEAHCAMHRFVEAARAAKMWVVGLGPVERVGAAHLVRESLEGLHWAELSHLPQANQLAAPMPVTF